MNKLFVATLLVVPAAAGAAGPAQHRFTQAGQTYVYTSATHGTREVIDGYSIATGGRFHLVVRQGMVTGQSNGQPVAFRVPASAIAVETAAR